MIKNIIIVLLFIWAFSATFLFFACRKMMSEYISKTKPKEHSSILTDHKIKLDMPVGATHYFSPSCDIVIYVKKINGKNYAHDGDDWIEMPKDSVFRDEIKELK